MPANASPKPKQHETANCNEAAQDNPVSPLLRPNPLHQPVDPGYLCRRACNPPLDAAQALSLQRETLIDGVCLAQHSVRHVVAVVQPPSLVEHVVCFGGFGVVACAVGVDVGAYVGEEVCAVARGGYLGL